MEAQPHPRTQRGRGGAFDTRGGRDPRPHSRNKQWVAEGSRTSAPTHGAPTNGERWERGRGHRGGRGSRGAPYRGRGGSTNRTLHNVHATAEPDEPEEMLDVEAVHEDVPVYVEDVLDTDGPKDDSPEERKKYYEKLQKDWEVERLEAIRNGLMDDPLVPKPLSEAITIVGTCPDMCPKLERYRREFQNNLFECETIPGTKLVDHKRAVKAYQRGVGDRVVPSDLRPPPVLQKTLDYLFHTLLSENGFKSSYHFIRDRSRCVRNDLTIQRLNGKEAMELHDRCARFHILSLHFGRKIDSFDSPMEVAELMKTLQSLKEFYEDSRALYTSPQELEMRVYHRLIHMRDQVERHENIPEAITSHPVFKLTSDFRQHVQKKSAPIKRNSPLLVGDEGMAIFGQLASYLREEGNIVMIFLVACILEHLFGEQAVEGIDSIRGDLRDRDIIDGVSFLEHEEYEYAGGEEQEEMYEDGAFIEEIDEAVDQSISLQPAAAPSSFFPQSSTGAFKPATASVFAPSSSSTAPASSSVFAPSDSFGVPASSSPFAPAPSSKPPTSTSPFAPSIAQSAPSSAFSNPFGVSNANPSPFTAKSPFSAPTSAPPAPVVSAFAPAPAAPSPFAPVTTTTTTNFFSKPSQPTNGSTSVFTPSSSHTDTFTQASTTTAPAPSSIPNFFAKPSAVTPAPLRQAESKTPTNGGIPDFFASSRAPTSEPAVGNPFLARSNPDPKPLNPFAPSFTPSSTPPKMNGAGTAASQPSAFPTAPAQPTIMETKAPPSLPALSIPEPQKASSSKSFVLPSPLKIDPFAPLEPPILARVQPVSLPSTPTSSELRDNPLVGHLKSNLALNMSSLPSSSSEILSPLNLNSPSTSKASVFHGFPSPAVPNGTVKTTETPPTVPPNVFGTGDDDVSSLTRKGKGKERETYTPSKLSHSVTASSFNAKREAAKALRKGQAAAFARRGTAVKNCFRTWQKRTTDKAAWLEAVEHGEAYRDRVRAEQAVSPSPRKRTMSSFSNSLSRSSNGAPPKKRARPRVSREYRPPIPDQELAKRFQENQDEHQRRWAKGSFLRIAREEVKSQARRSSLPAPDGWRIWLSLNPQVDGTAIWLEAKFGVPESGKWMTEHVFSIPLVEGEEDKLPHENFPGVLVFECTPLDGITDDLEKKYRILDDCSRLRDIVSSFPAHRHFVPSLLLFSWAEETEGTLGVDFAEQLTRLQNDSLITGYQILPVSSKTKDLDSRFSDRLHALELDVEGQLVRSLVLRAVFKLMAEPFESFASEWLANCTQNGIFQSQLYSHLVQVLIELLNEIAKLVSELILIPLNPPLPSFEPTLGDSDDSIYDATLHWLNHDALGNITQGIAIDLQSNRDMDRPFPARTFIDHLQELAHYCTQNQTGKTAKTRFYVSSAAIAPAVDRFRLSIRTRQARLSHIWNLNLRRSPKRRSMSISSDLDSASNTTSKRRKLSASSQSSPEEAESPYINGRNLPSPSPSSASLPTESSSVTVAMLKALTRDMKRKYTGGGSGSSGK